MRLLALSAALFLAACGERTPTQRELDWEGYQVARICRDGTHIYLLKNGDYRDGWNRSVVNISTVCQ